MKGAFRILTLTGATAMLAACACPATGDYNQTPYDYRTAGTGVAVYEGNCERAAPVVKERRTVVQEAEPIFRERVKK